MWIVCQVGAREHYAIPRALAGAGELDLLCTDAWVRPGSLWGRLPRTRLLRDRYHADLAGVSVFAPTERMLAFELGRRLRGRGGWEAIMDRNTLFQQQVIGHLSRRNSASHPNEEQSTRNDEQRTLFSYSCAGLELFRFAKSRGWKTVLGQIDPGPEEERLVAEERRRYPDLKTAWTPTPKAYWQQWREEVALADRIIVNSEWSRQCLLKEGVPPEKMEIVPLVVSGLGTVGGERSAVGGGSVLSDEELRTKNQELRTLSVLFLGQINLRKGVGRLLEAMRLLKDEAISLTLAGPCEIDPSAWADLPQVKWRGVIPRSEVGACYEEADLFILPTLSDGYALTQLEALAHGLPVLASRHCGEAVRNGENGWILDDLEPATIAAAIREARSALPLTKVQAPSFSLQDLAASVLKT
jgi:glycosyltransferase involved in cell wall biosynthesis